MKKTITNVVRYALVSLFSFLFIGSAVADTPAPVASWNQDFNFASKKGYTVSLGSNAALAADKGVTLTKATSGTGNTGIAIDWDPTTFSGHTMTVLVKYSGVTQSNFGGNTALVATYWGEAQKAKEILLNANNNQVKLAFNVTSGNSGNNDTVWTRSLPSSGLLRVQYTSGGIHFTFLSGSDGNWSKVSNMDINCNNIADLKKDAQFYGLKIGGSIAAMGSYYRPGMKVEAVSIFDSTLTDAELTAYTFPAGYPASMMYSNTLATSGATVSSDTYGEIVVPGAGFEATAYSAQTTVFATLGGFTGEHGIFYHYTGGWGYIQPHTVGMWVKVNELPASGEKDIYGFSTDGNQNNGYKLAVTSEGKLKIGKKHPNGTWNGDNYTTDHQITAGKWFYLTVSFNRDTSITGTYSPVSIRIYVNGTQVFSKDGGFSADLGGNNFSAFYIGAGVSAAGLYGDTTVVTDTAKIKSWATNPNLVEAAPAEVAVTITGTQDLSSLATAADIANKRLILNVTGEATLTIDEAISPKEISVNGSAALTIKKANNIAQSTFAEIYTSAFTGALTYEFDATTASFTADNALMTLIKEATTNVKFIFKGNGSNGATLSYGNTQTDTTINTHIVFDGGTHTWHKLCGSQGLKFGANATVDNPTMLVTNGATLNWEVKNPCGWGAGAANTAGILRIDDGSKVIYKQVSGTAYWTQQIYIEPGAEFVINDGNTNDPKFRIAGGTNKDACQIYVPARDTNDGKVAKITQSSSAVLWPKNEGTAGMAIFVGANSTLEFGAGVKNDRTITKYGDGKLVIKGTGFATPLTIAEGSLGLTDGSSIANLTINAATEIDVASGTGTISALTGEFAITKTGAGTLKLPNAYAGAISLTEGRIDQTFVGTLTFAGDLTFTAAELPLISTLAASGHTGSIKLPEGFFGQIAKISGEGKPSDLVIKDSTGAEITEGFAKDADGYLVLKADEITTVAEVSRPTEFVGAMRFGEGGGVTVKHATPDTPMYYTSDAITVAEGKKALVTLDLYGQYEVGTRFIMLTGASLPAVENFTCQLGATPARTTITPTVEGYGTGQALVFTIATSLISTQDDATKAALAKAVAHFDAGRFETLTLDDAGNISKWTNLGSQGETYDATPAGNGRAANDFPTFAIVDGRPVVDFGECNSQKDLGFTRVAIKAAIQVVQLKNDKRAWFLGDYGPEGKGTYSFHRDQANANPPLFNGNSKVTSVFDNGVDRGNGRTGVYPETMRVISVATDSAECYTDCFTMDRNNGDNRSGGRKLCETLLFTEELTAEERAAIESYLVEKWSLFKKISYSGDVSVSTINADIAGSYSSQIVLDDGATLSVNQSIAKPLSFICDGHFTVVGDGYSMTDDDLAKFDLLLGTATCVFGSDMEALPTVAPAAGVAYRFEKDYSEGIAFNLGGGIYEFAKAKITNFLSNQYTIRVQPGDEVWLDRTNGSNFSCSCANVEVLGGSLKVGREDNGATWIGNGTTYTISGGTVTSPVNGTGLSGNGNGFLLGYSGSGVTALNVTGGELLVPDSSINFWIKCAVALSGTGKIHAKGVINNGTASTVTISDNAVFKLGSLGWVSSVPLTLNGGTLMAVESSTFSAPITINAASPIEVEEGVTLTLSGAISGDIALSKSGTGTLALSSAARPKLGAIAAGKIRFVATADEVIASKIVIPTTETSYASGTIEVVDGTGTSVDVEDMTVSEGVLTIQLPRNVIEETSSVSQWKAMKGEVVIKAEDEETELTITVDDAFSADITAISVFGKVTFIFEDAAAASTVPINIQNGGSVSISGPVPAVPMTIASGATLTLNDGTSFAGQITVNGGAELIVDGAVTASAVIAMPGAQNSKLTVNPGAVLALTQSLPFSGNNGTFNIYGTIDVSGNWEYNSNPATAIFNFYAGSTLTGAGHWNMAGGFNPCVNVFDFDSPTKYVTFDIVRGHGGWNQPTEFKVKDPGVGIKILKNFDNTNNTISGSDVCGIELAVGGLKVTDVDANTKTKVSGAVKIAAGATLTLDVDNAFTNEVAALDLQIAGTLNGNSHSQDIAVLNVTNNMMIVNGVFPNATVTVKEGVTLTTTGSALQADNFVVNGTVNGAIMALSSLSGTGSVTTATLADVAYLDATAGTLTISTLQTEGDKIVIKCKASGGALVKGLTADPSANVKLIDPSGAEIPLRKGRFKFKDGELSFMFNAFLLMLK